MVLYVFKKHFTFHNKYQFSVLSLMSQLSTTTLKQIFDDSNHYCFISPGIGINKMCKYCTKTYTTSSHLVLWNLQFASHAALTECSPMQTLFAAVFISEFIYKYTQTHTHTHTHTLTQSLTFTHITEPAVANSEFCKSHTVQHSKVCIVFLQQL